MTLGMLNMQDPIGNHVPLPENPSNMKQDQESGTTSVSLNKLSHLKVLTGPSHTSYRSVVSRAYAEVIYHDPEKGYAQDAAGVVLIQVLGGLLRDGPSGTSQIGHPLTAEIPACSLNQRGWWEGWLQHKYRGVCGPSEGRDLLWCSKQAPDYRIEMRCQDPTAAPTPACSHPSTPPLHICHLPNLGLQSIFSFH